MQKGKFNIIFDQSWGSSAKGAASTRLADIFKVENASTNNAANAGHVVQDKNVRYLFKALPSSAALNRITGNKVRLWVGPQSYFFLDQFHKEVDMTGYHPLEVNIHGRAAIAGQRHIDMEKPGGPWSTEYISSTMSGSGPAYVEKAMRRPEVLTVDKLDGLSGIRPTNFAMAIRDELLNAHTFIHEVSQGYALSVDYGTQYPNCTFRNCTPQQAIADMMIPFNMVGDIYMNVRSFNIRVGNNYRDGQQVGYSGDFLPDQVETTWEQIGKNAGMPQSEIDILAEKERTTVTKKIRRVATQSWSLLENAAKMCCATKLILNFPQYLTWTDHKLRGGGRAFRKLSTQTRAYIDKMEQVTNLPVVMVGTSAEHEDYIWLE